MTIAVFCNEVNGKSNHYDHLDLRILLIPIGAYEPRWFMRQNHMDPYEAVRAHLDLRPRRSICMHFGTFQCIDETTRAPSRAKAGAYAFRHHRK